MQERHPDRERPSDTWRMRFLSWRNRVLASRSFQRFAAGNPLLRPVARRRAGALFDLVAGFTYTQTLLAFVESGMLERLSRRGAAEAELRDIAGLSEDATLRLLRASAALGLVEEAQCGWWVLGLHGAPLSSNAGALAMIRHHRLLYADLADPLAMLRDDRMGETRLSQFWTYAAAAGGTDGADETAAEYSRLMAVSQAAVAEEVLDAFPFGRFKSLLDVGGGSGAFLAHIAEAHPHLRLGLFDLPPVARLAEQSWVDISGGTTPEFKSGSFFSDSLPGGYDLVTLVRILHDHDDEQAQQLLVNIHRSMAPGAQLLIAEPMAKTPGAERMGDAYFGLYLWAMRQGRPRPAREIRRMLADAGFRSSRLLPTHQPVVASLVVARA